MPDTPVIARTREEKLNDSLRFLEQVRKERKPRAIFALKREQFEPSNIEHLKSYYSFLETGRWGSVQFFVEYPFENAVDTVTKRYAKHALEEKLGVK